MNKASLKLIEKSLLRPAMEVGTRTSPQEKGALKNGSGAWGAFDFAFRATYSSHAQPVGAGTNSNPMHF